MIQLEQTLFRILAAVVLIPGTALLSWGGDDPSIEESLPEVIGVFVPGQGQNIVRDGPLPSSFTSQKEMYAGLVAAMPDLTDSKLLDHYRAITFDRLPRDRTRSVDEPADGVRIVRDRQHNIPRVYGKSRFAAMFGAGYARAQDRLWQMDVNRHIWRANLVGLLGFGTDNEYLNHDAMVFRRLDYSEEEYARMFETLDERFGKWGRYAQEDLQAFTDGINAYIDAISADQTLLPVEYERRDLRPGKWRVTDHMAEAAHGAAAYGFGPGSVFGVREEGNARLLKQLERRYDPGEARRIYDDFRQRCDDEAPYLSDERSDCRADGDDPAALALPELDSFVPTAVVVGLSGVTEGVAGDAFPSSAYNAGPAGRSNVLMISGRHTRTGRPMSVQGPQDGYELPHQQNSEIQIVAPDVAIHGLLEYAGPYPVNGARGRGFVVSITAQHPDQADLFAEKLCEPSGDKPTLHAMHYVYKGDCLAIEIRSARRTPEGAGKRFELRSERTVHGPVIGRAMVEGTPVALSQARATFMDEGESLAAFARLVTPSAMTSAADFHAAMAHLSGGLAMYYISRDEIAWAHGGVVPRRSHGVSGDFPVWGTGEWDWEGFSPERYRFDRIPFSGHPKGVNPESGIIAAWNGPHAHGWSIADNVWQYGLAHRQKMLQDLILKTASTTKLGRSGLIKIHQYAQLTDVRAYFLYPLMRELIGHLEAEGAHEAILSAADQWVADGALRGDFDEDGHVEHGAAIAVLDRWWPVLLEAYFTPIVGAEVMSEAGVANNLQLRVHSNPGTGAMGWTSHLSKDFRALLGSPVASPLSRTYCADGTVAGCRTLLITTLSRAIGLAEDTFGPDILTRKYPATCRANCVQITFHPTGAAGMTSPIPWQNRPTYELSASFR